MCFLCVLGHYEYFLFFLKPVKRLGKVEVQPDPPLLGIFPKFDLFFWRLPLVNGSLLWILLIILIDVIHSLFSSGTSNSFKTIKALVFGHLIKIRRMVQLKNANPKRGAGVNSIGYFRGEVWGSVNLMFLKGFIGLHS